jgi:hypothetical protein
MAFAHQCPGIDAAGEECTTAVKVVRLEVLDFDEPFECAVAVYSGRLGPQYAIEDQGNAVDVHGCLTK